MPPSSTARSPSTRPGRPRRRSRRRSSPRARRRGARNSASPGSPWWTRYSPSLIVRISRLARRRDMIVTESWRSSAVSTAVTSAFESCVAPRRVLAERVAVPLLEVGEADLGRELAVGVVDPVPGELARAEHLEARRAVGADGERERGPHRRRRGTARTAGASRARGAGRPVRPPVVCTNVTSVSVTGGSWWRSGSGTGSNVARSLARRTVVAPMRPPPEQPASTILPVLDLGPAPAAGWRSGTRSVGPPLRRGRR